MEQSAPTALAGGRSVSEPILKTEDLSKSFGALTVLESVTLSFDRGECHGLIGPNGSGKTTLFNLLTGFHEPDSGVVRFDGQDITSETPDRIARRGLVRTFQIVAPFDGLTVRENLLAVHNDGFGSGLHVDQARRERADELLEWLDLTQVADQLAGNVSGGQQKLLELGRVLMLDPECILLDEPTAGVNPALAEQVLQVLRDLNNAGTTLVIIEHDMDVVERLADQITVLDGGRFLTQGTFAEVTDDGRVQEAYIGTGTGKNGSSKGVHQADNDTSLSTDAAADPIWVSEPVADGATVSPTAASTGGDRRLVAENVVAGYGNQVILDGVSVQSCDGVTCIFGPNGSGKSTLLKALAGTVPVRSGTVTYGGRSLTDLAPHEVVSEGVTAVSQSDPVFRGLTVRENLQLGATTVNDDAVADERLETVLELFPPLEASLSEPARSLSGGQQAMLGVARGMMSGAEVYLLDEPLSGLDPSTVETVLGVIETLTDAGTQVVLVEQYVSAALRVADHAYVLSGGEIQFDGTAADLKDEDELLDLYLSLG